MQTDAVRLVSTVVFTLALLIATVSFAQELPSCDSATVQYGPFDEQFAAKMTVQPGPAPRSAVIMGDKQFTRQHTRWMIARNPDYMKAGPWTTVVWIGSKDKLLMLTFRDHGNGGVSVQWLNEKLIYGSVGWGRIVSTDFIFNVEKQAFIYREMANYGEFVQPCQ
jgi:hypothetical protein